MEDIAFTKPLVFTLSLIDTDDRMPSVQFLNRTRFASLHDSTSFEGSFWFACEEWDTFVVNLRCQNCSALLQSMNKEFILHITYPNGTPYLLWRVAHDFIDGSNGQISFSARLNLDDLGIIKSKFMDFPKWW